MVKVALEAAMRVGIPTEVHPGERRVAATPDTVQKLIKLGFEGSIQAGAGEGAKLDDAVYAEAGATVVDDVNAALTLTSMLTSTLMLI